MDMHYAVLGLPGGAAAAAGLLTEQEIHKAYKSRALELHPDKRPDDPDAHAKFLQLKQSYEILKTKAFKGSRKKKPDIDRQGQYNSNSNSDSDSKRRRMMSDLEKRERFAADPIMKAAAAAQEEEKIARQLKADISRIRATIKKRRTNSIPFDYKEEKKVLKPLAIPNPIISAAVFNSLECNVLDKLRKQTVKT